MFTNTKTVLLAKTLQSFQNQIHNKVDRENFKIPKGSLDIKVSEKVSLPAADKTVLLTAYIFRLAILGHNESSLTMIFSVNSLEYHQLNERYTINYSRITTASQLSKPRSIPKACKPRNENNQLRIC